MLRLLRSKPEFCLAALFLLLYVPFLGEPVLRTTGDEKVYVAQALEMARHESWFTQTLAEQANYYKPPLHYILLRAGFWLFGEKSLWAVLWMNLAAMTFALGFLVRTIRQRPFAESTAWWVGAGILLSPGIFAHMFASQMEVELIALYTAVLALLLARRWTMLWVLIGLASWIKSPVHSVLLASSTGLIVFSDRQLRFRLRSVKILTAPCLGVAVGLLSVGIPWILDGENYYKAYILRETIGKGANAVTILQAIVPNFSYHLWPAVPALVLGTVAVGYGWLQKIFAKSELRALASAFFLVLPTLLFFAIHPYRSEIYMLPIVPPLILWSVLGWQKAEYLWPRLVRWTHQVWLFTALAPACLIVSLYFRFHPDSSWWPLSFSLIAFLVLVVQFALVLVWAESRLGSLMIWMLALGITAGFMQVLGRFDVRDLQNYAARHRTEETFGFYNAQKFLWSEWGLLNFTGGFPVKGLHRPDEICAWLYGDKPLIIARHEFLQTLPCHGNFEVYPWTRWQSHGDHNASFGPRPAWQHRDLSLLQGHYYIVRLKHDALREKS